MAFLVDIDTGQNCFLRAHHSFGRLIYAVDTVISQPQISKHHAIIEWHNRCWHIRDISSNGTWLNQTKLQQNTRYQLNLHDKIYLANANHATFLVANLDAPCDLLLRYDAKSDAKSDVKNDGKQNPPTPPISLNRYHLLPDQAHPEIVLFIDSATEQWCIERLTGKQETDKVVLNDNDVIEFHQQKWQLKLSHDAVDTKPLHLALYALDKLHFIFNLSLDEEETQLSLQTPDKLIDFYVRSHHYLTLNLARYRALDADKGLDSQLQGWVYPEQLMQDLGIDISHLNIQIHRVRKQLADALHDSCNVQGLIERQSGKLRFGGSVFTIYKGQQLECAVSATDNEGD